LTDQSLKLIGGTVTGQRDREMVLVPRNPTPEMLEAGADDAHNQDARGVWESMIACHEEKLKLFVLEGYRPPQSSGNSEVGS
jgi:hypothetical protein